MAVARLPEAPDSTSLLDLVPELGEGLGEATYSAVRRGASVVTLPIAPGPWDPTALVQDGSAFGFLVADGAIVREVLMAGSVCSDLLGAGDVAGLGDDGAQLVPAELRWTVSAPSRVAILDAALLTALTPWPGVTSRLLTRATRQTSTLAVQRAISQLPRVDQRLLALFWHLAERWGRVSADGVVVRLALTHETLGRMVGARRPTVSLALKELAGEGAIVRRGDGAWVLRRDGLDRLVPEGRANTAQAPDAAVLPDLGVSRGRAEFPRPVPTHQPTIGEELRVRLTRLDEARADQQQRVKEVLARCAETREQLIQSRQRRAEQAASRLARPPR